MVLIGKQNAARTLIHLKLTDRMHLLIPTDKGTVLCIQYSCDDTNCIAVVSFVGTGEAFPVLVTCEIRES